MVSLLLVGLVGWTTYSTLSNKPFCSTCLLPEDTALAGVPESPVGVPQIPAWRGKALSGEILSRERFVDKIVVYQFWATWCAPCLDELETLRGLHAEYPDAAFEIVSFSLDDLSASELQGFTEKHGYTFPVVPDDGLLLEQFGGSGRIPYTVVAAPGGAVVRIFSGLASEASLREAIDSAGRSTQ